jgi:hypothetical protein
MGPPLSGASVRNPDVPASAMTGAQERTRPTTGRGGFRPPEEPRSGTMRRRNLWVSMRRKVLERHYRAIGSKSWRGSTLFCSIQEICSDLREELRYRDRKDVNVSVLQF